MEGISIFIVPIVFHMNFQRSNINDNNKTKFSGLKYNHFIISHDLVAHEFGQGFSWFICFIWYQLKSLNGTQLPGCLEDPTLFHLNVWCLGRHVWKTELWRVPLPFFVNLGLLYVVSSAEQPDFLTEFTAYA